MDIYPVTNKTPVFIVYKASDITLLILDKPISSSGTWKKGLRPSNLWIKLHALGLIETL